MSTLSPLLPHNRLGVLLCGGQGSRLGGIDKGWVEWEGTPLVQRTLARLRPQVAAVVISANRHLDRYRALGHPVVTDGRASFPGPLAGWEAALNAQTARINSSETHADGNGYGHRHADPAALWMVSAPCDAPLLPDAWVTRLAQAVVDTGALAAFAETQEPDGGRRAHPTIAIVHGSLLPALSAALDANERAVWRWLRARQAVPVRFEQAAAFANLNTWEALKAAQGTCDHAHPISAVPPEYGPNAR